MDGTREGGHAAGWARATAWAWPLLLGGVGLLVAQHQVLRSGFADVQADVCDARFHHYVLEHGWRWLTGDPLHPRFWDAQFFHPTRDEVAWSDPMLGVAPMYWVWRAVGFLPDTSLQLWILTVHALNFASFFLLLRRSLRLSPFAAASGALLFAFAACRVTQAAHPQLYAQFWAVGCLVALHALFTSEAPARRRVALWAAAACAVLQLWGGFYQGWLLGLSLLVAGAWALADAAGRARLWATVRAHPLALAGAALASAAALAPMAWAFYEASRAIGLRAFAELEPLLPRPASWLYQGPGSWLYGGLADAPLYRGLPNEHEQRLGVGFFTTALALWGAALAWRRRDARLALLVGATVLVASLFAFDRTLWTLVYHVVPGAKAVRAVARVVFVVLVPVSVGVAVALERLAATGRTRALAGVALVLVVAEQGQTVQAYEKARIREAVASVVRAIPREGCDAFFYTALRGTEPVFQYDLDAMWAQLESGVPTVNGYTSRFPAGWELLNPNVTAEAPEALWRARLDAWVARAGLDPARVCWVKVGLQEGPYRAVVVSQVAPERVAAGARAPVRVTVRNAGATAWTREEAFRLGWAGPTEDSPWGVARVELPHAVPPGGEVTFAFDVTAPPAPGRVPMRWRMLREHVRWFGEVTAEVGVAVDATAARASP